MDHWRSFPLAKLAPVADVPGVQLVRLQAVDGLDQIPALNGRFPIITLDSRRPRDFVDTAAIISQLDLVITPDTSVAHLAGRAGCSRLARALDRRRVAMDARPRGQPLVSHDADLPPDAARRLG